MRNLNVVQRKILVIGALLSGAAIVVQPGGAEELPENTVLTTAAWEAFNAGDYQGAVSRARQVIDKFGGAADREQSELEKQQAPLPPQGKVSDSQKQTIFARGLLNDVATCYFIIGRAAERLNQMDLARESYREAAKYSHARAWDPKGWFWSPAEAAEDRLAKLR